MQSLKALVIGMGVLIVLAMGLLVWGFYTRARNLVAEGGAEPATAAPFQAALDAPMGCEPAEIAADQGRLYVRMGPAGPCARVLVFDGATGRALGSLAPPR